MLCIPGGEGSGITSLGVLGTARWVGTLGETMPAGNPVFGGLVENNHRARLQLHFPGVDQVPIGTETRINSPECDQTYVGLTPV